MNKKELLQVITALFSDCEYSVEYDFVSDSEGVLSFVNKRIMVVYKDKRLPPLLTPSWIFKQKLTGSAGKKRRKCRQPGRGEQFHCQ